MSAAPSVEAATQIFRELSAIPFGTLAAVWVLAGASLAAIPRALPRLIDRLPPALRPYLYPWPPVLRLAVLVITIGASLALVVRPATGAITALLGTAAVALGFALRDLASDLAAGIVAVFERPYGVGDWVRIGDVYGEVVAVDLRAVILITHDDDRVTIPHSQLWTQPIASATGGHLALQVQVRFYLDPDHDSGEAVRVLRDVTMASPFFAAERPVEVQVVATGWAVRYTVRAYPRTGQQQFRFATDVTVRGRAALGRRGIRQAREPFTDRESPPGLPA